MLNIALALTLFATSSCALPITPIHWSSGPSLAACLAVLAALFLGLSLLVFLKRVYIQKRRANVSQMQHNSILSLPVGSTSVIASVDSVNSQSEKAGFMAGFFGSPSIEIQCALEQAEWKENKQSSFTYQIHTDSRRRRLDYPSVLDISRHHKNSTSPRPLDQSPLLQEPHSFNLPSFPDKAHLSLHPRRFSLPAMNRTVAHESQRRRHSSLKSARGRRSVTFVPGNPSLRIVDASVGFETPPLPLSPEFRIASPEPSPGSASHPPSPRFSSRLARSLMPPLPSLPFTNSPQSPIQRGGTLQISHPYALVPHPRKGVQTIPPSQTEKSAAQVRQPASTTNTNFVSLELPALSSTLSPTSPTLSSVPTAPPITSILKPKLRVRTRRSPTIGPSPLRTMILPESLDSELSSYAQRRVNNKDNDAKDHPVSTYSPYASQGGTTRVGDLGDGSGKYTGVGKTNPGSVSSRRALKVEEDDPSVLLGIIRELVEETNEWDPSTVFMSKNFKNLLQESGIAATKSTRGGFLGAETSGTDESQSDRLNRSAEANIGLLGLDVFASESSHDTGPYHGDDSTNLISFWDEESTERNEIVGLAW